MPPAPERRINSDRFFYLFASSLLLAVTAGGFRSFLFRGTGPGGGQITSRILPLVVFHGLAMFGWCALFLLQSLLMITRNRRLHMALGRVGAVLAAVIVVLGALTAALSVHFNPANYKAVGGAISFLAIMLSQIFCFGLFVGLGVVYRRRAEIHGPMMLLATVAVSAGSLARFPYSSWLSGVAPLYSNGPMLILAVLFFVLQWKLSRAASRWHAAGLAGLAVVVLISVVVGQSSAWQQIAGAIVP